MVKQNNRLGFSLLELLVSATIIAVLTTIGVVSYSSVNKRSRDVKRKSDIEQIRSALEMYRADNGGYPAVNTGSFGTVTALSPLMVTSSPSYMPAIPEDPNNTTQNYWYEAINASGGMYYGYCVCAKLETSLPTMPNTCTGETLPPECNYGLKNP